MSVTISSSKSADRQAILELLDEARADKMSKEERTRYGFIQGNMNEEYACSFSGRQWGIYCV